MCFSTECVLNDWELVNLMKLSVPDWTPVMAELAADPLYKNL